MAAILRDGDRDAEHADPAAGLDRRDLAAGRRHRRDEHHAGQRHRAHARDRHPHGDRRAHAPTSCCSSTPRRWWSARSAACIGVLLGLGTAWLFDSFGRPVAVLRRAGAAGLRLRLRHRPGVRLPAGAQGRPPRPRRRALLGMIMKKAILLLRWRCSAPAPWCPTSRRRRSRRRRPTPTSSRPASSAASLAEAKLTDTWWTAFDSAELNQPDGDRAGQQLRHQGGAGPHRAGARADPRRRVRALSDLRCQGLGRAQRQQRRLRRQQLLSRQSLGGLRARPLGRQPGRPSAAPRPTRRRPPTTPWRSTSCCRATSPAPT